MSTQKRPGPHDALAAALPDEPYFALLARDRSAPDLVRRWALHRRFEISIGLHPASDEAKVTEALEVAAEMMAWRAAHLHAWRKNAARKATDAA